MDIAITNGGTWGEAFSLRWPQVGYTIVTEPTGPWGEAWLAHPRQRIPMGAAAQFHDPDWEFEDVEPEGDPSAPGWPGPRYRYRVRWPAGGIFVPERDEARAPVYEPLTVAAQILRDVQRTRAEDPTALLAFVTRWGRLGIGIPGAPTFDADGVERTGQWLAWLTAMVETVHALQRRQPAPMSWTDVADALSRNLERVRFGARSTTQALVPHFVVPRLLDALVLEVWAMATGDRRLRRCPECQVLFLHGREDKRYCSAACAKRRTVREWKRKQRRRQRRTTRSRSPKEV